MTELQKYITERDLDKLLNYFWKRNENKFALLTMLLFYTGCRISEMLNIKLEHIDFKSRQIYINKTKTKNPRVVFFPVFCISYIKEIIKNLYLKQNDFLFTACHTRDKHLDRSHICKLLADASNQCGIIHIHPHTLRKSFGVMIAKQTRDIRTIQLLLGHRSARTTIDYYLPYTLDDVHKDYDNVFKSVARKTRE